MVYGVRIAVTTLTVASRLMASIVGVNITICTQTVDCYEKTCFKVLSNMLFGYCTTEQCEHRPHATSKRSSQPRLVPEVTTLLFIHSFI